FSFITPEERERLGIIGMEELQRATRECAEIFSHRDHPAHPPKKRRQILLLIFDIDRLEMVFGINRDRKIELLRIRSRKAGVAIAAPLHRGAATIAIAEIKIVAHPNFIAVVEDWGAGHRKKENVEQLDLAPAIIHQRR